MTSDEVRQTFLDFFASRGHRLLGSASLIPDNDPTLLYINSGMAPLKRYFTGEERPPAPDLCNVQPCIRTTDIDDVGDRHHLTFFEMMGSWSIDHYFKERAIALAFELLVDGFGYDRHRLYATVFSGNPELGLPADDVSARIWESVGMPPDHIVGLGMDNFWGPAGDSGPCGPCTEVFYDTGDGFGEPHRPGGEFDSARRYIEIWNAGVFMEYNKHPDGSFSALPFTSVDTGAGLERMAMVLGKHETVYETDLLSPIVARVEELGPGLSQGDVRLLSDHLRASTMILAEGVRPSNLGRGYIPRRLIRKSVEVVTRSGIPDFDFAGVIDAVVDRMGGHHPHLLGQRDRVVDHFDQERGEFARVVARGIEQLDRMKAPDGRLQVSGREAFFLFATFGMPFELVRDHARQHGGDADAEGFQAEFRQHQEVSRVGTRPREAASAHLGGDLPATDFTGYRTLAQPARVVGLWGQEGPISSATAGSAVRIALDSTPFYAESGGQVGDRGALHLADHGAVVRIDGASRTGNGVIVHHGLVVEGELEMAARVEAEVDPDGRLRTAANHSATHLLQAALRRILGDHVRQAGSLVEARRLRFDLTHPRPVTRGELVQIERLVNDWILADMPCETEERSYQEAVAGGALFLPGEAYSQRVRVVRIGEVSKELCGGTHVSRSSQLGLFRLVSESSVAAGVRRVVAITRDAALDSIAERDQVLGAVAAELGTGWEGIPDRVRALLQSRTREKRKGAPVSTQSEVTVHTTSHGLPYVAQRLDGDPAGLREQAAQLADQHRAIVLLTHVGDSGTVRVVTAVAADLEAAHDAAGILRRVLPIIAGTGGGNRRLAQGGGRRPEGVARILEDFETLLAEPGSPAATALVQT